METNVRAKGPKAFIAKICAVLFLLIMIVFTLYPIVYTVLGSLKTNAELTAGGSFLPKSWQFQNYYQAFIQADFVKYTWKQRDPCRFHHTFGGYNLRTGGFHLCAA